MLIGGDHYLRGRIPRLRVGNEVTRRSQPPPILESAQYSLRSTEEYALAYRHQAERERADTLSDEIYEISSVSENVTMLERALERAQNDMPILDELWQTEIDAYGTDLRRRIWPSIFGSAAVAILRQTALDSVIECAITGLESYVTSDEARNSAFARGQGWVLYLLETHLGHKLNKIHQSLPDESNGSYGDPPRLQEIEKSLMRTLHEVQPIIGKIRSSWDPSAHFQFFDREGIIFSNTASGLRREGTAKSAENLRVPGDENSEDSLHKCLRSHDATRTHDVIIDLSKEEWAADSEGLGVGYVSGMVADTSSGHMLLAFSFGADTE